MLIDSNIIVYSLTDESPKKDKSQEFIRNQIEVGKIVISHQNIFETMRVITHPKFSSPFNVQQATKALYTISSASNVVYPTKETQDIAFALIQKYSITGSEIFDAYMVATAVSNGCYQIATDNEKHLGKYKEIEVINPFS